MLLLQVLECTAACAQTQIGTPQTSESKSSLESPPGELWFVQALQTFFISFCRLFCENQLEAILPLARDLSRLGKHRFVPAVTTFKGPDVWGKNYAWSSDIWSMGCILYEMCARTFVSWKSSMFHSSILIQILQRSILNFFYERLDLKSMSIRDVFFLQFFSFVIWQESALRCSRFDTWPNHRVECVECRQTDWSNALTNPEEKLDSSNYEGTGTRGLKSKSMFV